MRIGIAFDLAPTGPSAHPADGPDDQFEEYDKPETVDAIASVLRNRGHDVRLLGDGPPLLRALLDDPPDLVWNMAEGTGSGRSREARVPAVLEMLGIPYTGSDPLTMAATLDKEAARSLVKGDGMPLSLPKGGPIPAGVDKSSFVKCVNMTLRTGAARRVILKPSFEGSSKGIRSRCLATSADEAYEVYLELARDYNGSVQVEEFIEGDELTVGLIGNSPTTAVIGTMKVVPRQPDPHFVYSLDVKRDWANRVDYEAPARLASETLSRVEMAALTCYEFLGCRDLARIDFRLRDGVPYFIEANPLPGLAPITSDLVILAQGHGIDHASLINRIFDAALARLGMAER